MSKKEYYRPLPDYLTIGEAKWLTEITGKRQLGCFATDVIYQDTIMGITHYIDDRGEDGLIRTPLGGFFNHSEKANCAFIKDIDNGIYQIKTIRDVYEGEELLCIYTDYDPTK